MVFVTPGEYVYTSIPHYDHSAAVVMYYSYTQWVGTCTLTGVSTSIKQHK